MQHVISFELFEARRQADLDDRVLFRDYGLYDTSPDRTIDWHQPIEKDYKRATDMLNKPNRIGAAEAMAKLITDREKLIRRVKAIIEVCSRREPDAIPELMSPFIRRAEALGFNQNQIIRLIDWRPGRNH